MLYMSDSPPEGAKMLTATVLVISAVIGLMVYWAVGGLKRA
jgi:hypothetical protein